PVGELLSAVASCCTPLRHLLYASLLTALPLLFPVPTPPPSPRSGGPLATEAIAEMVASLFSTYVDSLSQLLPAPSVASDRLEEEKALMLLRALHTLRSQLTSFEAAFTGILLSEIADVLAGGTPRSSAQRASASSWSETLTQPSPSPLALAHTHMGQLLVRGQEGALAALMAGVARAVGEVGEELLGLPQRLGPFVNGPTLSDLSPMLKLLPGDAPPAVEESNVDSDTAMEWLLSIGHGTVCLLVDEIVKISRLTPLGARQLAADTIDKFVEDATSISKPIARSIAAKRREMREEGLQTASSSAV
ncbi:MAG: hypothetical protein SGPRY_009747, partial [Prymnesium sp.]